MNTPLWLILLSMIVGPILVVVLGLIIEYRTGMFNIRRKKELTVILVSRTDLAKTDNDTLGDKLQILFNGQFVSSVESLVIKIKNSGNVPISASDFEQPTSLTLDFGDSNILDYSVTHTEPDSLKPTFRLPEVKADNIRMSTLFLAPTLINTEEVITLSVLLDSPNKTNLKASARLLGTKIRQESYDEVSQMRLIESSLRLITGWFVLQGVVAAIIMLLIAIASILNIDFFN